VSTGFVSNFDMVYMVTDAEIATGNAKHFIAHHLHLVLIAP